jgi:hypothetical protein
MAVTTYFGRKAAAAALALFTFGAGTALTASDAEARYRHGRGGAVVAGAIIGLAGAAIIANSARAHSYGYPDYAYAPPAYAYQPPVYSYGRVQYDEPAVYDGPAYYGPQLVQYRERYRNRRVQRNRVYRDRGYRNDVPMRSYRDYRGGTGYYPANRQLPHHLREVQ